LRVSGVHIGLVVFYTTDSRYGVLSCIEFRRVLFRSRSCNIAHAVLLRNAWQSFHCELESRAHHASSPWNRQRYGGECARSSSRRSEERRVGKGGCATRSNNTCFEKEEYTSGCWDLKN